MYLTVFLYNIVCGVKFSGGISRRDLKESVRGIWGGNYGLKRLLESYVIIFII